jgi:hypothetical protein
MFKSTSTVHLSKAAALATKAEHFAKVGGAIHAYIDEELCWRFIHNKNEAHRSDPANSLGAEYLSRRRLAA